MISVWHLLWIVPVATMFGFVLCALLSANKNDDDVTDVEDPDWEFK